MKNKSELALFSIIGIGIGIIGVLVTMLPIISGNMTSVNLSLTLLLSMIVVVVTAAFLVLFRHRISSLSKYIFVYYSQNDDYANALLDYIRKVSILNLYSCDDIYIGDNIIEKRNKLISSSTAILLIIDENNKEDDFLLELLNSNETIKPILPLVEISIEKDIHPLICTIKYLSFNKSDHSNIKTIYSQILKAVRSIPPQKQAYNLKSKND